MIERPETRARTLLADLLGSDDRVRAREAIDAGVAAGLSERTVRRAARALTLHPEREGFGPSSTVWWVRARRSSP